MCPASGKAFNARRLIAFILLAFASAIMVRVCPQFISSGTCTDSSCAFRHDVLVCEDCGVVCHTHSVFDAHVKGRRHRAKVSGVQNVYYCSACERNIPKLNWATHTTGKSHRKAVERHGITGVEPKLVVSDIEGHKYCDICSLHVLAHHWDKHSISRFHKRHERFMAFKSVLDEAERDKNGVRIEGSFDFDIIDPSISANGATLTPTVKTEVPSSKVSLLAIQLLSQKGRKSFTSQGFSVEMEGPNRMITYTRPVNLKVSFSKSHPGHYEDRVEFTFEDLQLKKQFIISRSLRAIVGNKADYELLRPTAPYIPKERLPRQPETTVVEGVLPPALNAIPYVVKLPKDEIPKALLAILEGEEKVAEIMNKVRKVYIPKTLDGNTYARHFKHLIWIEEFRTARDLERYDMHDARLSKYNSYYYLPVPGLAEKRPSVLIGDRILAQKHGSAEGHWFEGRVHVLRQAEVGLRFHHSFPWNASSTYNVRFKLNRVPLRRQHQALDTVFAPTRIFFPIPSQLPATPHHSFRIQTFDPLISSNLHQWQAVQAILRQPPGSLPFVVFGPPGTGKTVTIVEAIRQVLRANPNARILACAPSNSAADLIALRLHALSTNELFRFYAPSRYKDQVPDELSQYTYTNGQGQFSVPALDRMMRFRVVVTTCISASVIPNIGIPRGHYTHIFVDEAGQATEPEVCVSIKTAADNNTNIILSGDPKQLGPIVRSRIAQQLGLEKSLIERLMETDAYNLQNESGKSVVKLTKNFRSHKTILSFPNEMFYDNELQACADQNKINFYLKWPLLPAAGFPIVFHAISGKDDREASSPSFFNISEVSQVKSYIQKLREDRKFRITDDDIGVISPYHAQCQKIRASLKPIAHGVKVGSVEEFQGQERRVIIISTVRSSKEFVEYDIKHTLGFVASPRRFNVSVTRAQALLIIVGDPQVLSLDPLWRSFLNYIHNHGGWVGEPITWDPNEPVRPEGGYDRTIRDEARLDMNDFSRRMEELTLTGAIDEETEIADAQIEKPWCEME